MKLDWPLELINVEAIKKSEMDKITQEEETNKDKNRKK